MFHEPGIPSLSIIRMKCVLLSLTDSATNTPGKVYTFGRYLNVFERKITEVHPDPYDGWKDYDSTRGK